LVGDKDSTRATQDAYSPRILALARRDGPSKITFVTHRLSSTLTGPLMSGKPAPDKQPVFEAVSHASQPEIETALNESVAWFLPH